MNELPSMEFTFDLNKKSKSGKVFEGSFTYKRLSIGSQGKAGVLKARLNGDLVNVDPDIDRLHDMLSWLKYGLVEFPDWWRDSDFGSNLYELDIIEEVYRMVTKFEKEWNQKVQKDGSKPVTEDSPKAN